MTDKLIWRDVRRDVNNATRHFETGLSAIETGFSPHVGDQRVRRHTRGPASHFLQRLNALTSADMAQADVHVEVREMPDSCGL